MERNNKGQFIKGIKFDEEFKLKMKVPKMKKMQELTKQKISNKLKGRISPMKGKSQTEEHKRKIGLANSISLKGNKWSEESKQKMRISMLNHIKKIRGKIRTNIGKYEKEILDLLQNQIGFSIKRQFYINGYYLDGYCQELNLAIEVDEEAHYKNVKLRDKDIIKQNNIIQALNCKFLRIREKDYLNNKENKLCLKI